MGDLDDIRSYRFAADQWKALRLQRFRRSLVIFGIIFVVVAVVAVVQAAGGASPFVPVSVGSFYVTTMALAGAGYLWFLWRSATQTTHRLVSYQITMGPNVLRIAMLGLLPTEVLRTSVRTIVEDRTGLNITYDGGLVGVPSSLPDYAEVRARLSGWTTIQARSERRLVVLLGVLAAAWFAQFSDRLPLVVLLAVQVGIVVTLALGVVHFRRTRLDAKQMARLIAIFGMCGLWVVVRIVMEVSQWLHTR